jgi:hypothetical protein
MKNLPSTVFMAGVLLVLPLAITACDRKTETRVVKEAAPAAAPAPAPVHETTIINEHPAPVVHDTVVHDTTVIKETDQERRDHEHDHDHDHDNH